MNTLEQTETELHVEFDGAGYFPAPVPTITTDEGFIINIETGEIISAEGEPEIDPLAAEIMAKVDLDWALEKLLRVRSNRAGIEARRDAYLKTYIESIDGQLKAQDNKEKYILYRYGHHMRACAERIIGMGKGKSYKSDFGTIQFRTTPGSLAVKDEAAAIEWLYENSSVYPGAVKVTEKVLVSMLKGHESELPEDLFETIPPAESCSINIGVGSAIKLELQKPAPVESEAE